MDVLVLMDPKRRREYTKVSIAHEAAGFNPQNKVMARLSIKCYANGGGKAMYLKIKIK